MLPSLHDDFLVSYEVNCEIRQIKLCAKRDPRLPAVKEAQTTRIIIFNGVEGYQFENDAFGNIVFSLEAVPVALLLATYGSRIAESYRMAGAPGSWAGDMTSAPQVLAAMGIPGLRAEFIIRPFWLDPREGSLGRAGLGREPMKSD